MDNTTHIYIQAINCFEIHKCRSSVVNSVDALIVRYKELNEWIKENRNNSVKYTQEFTSLMIERKFIKEALEKADKILETNEG